MFAAGLLVRAQDATPARGYGLSWWTVDGGGHTFSTGGGYSLGATAGQPDAGVMTGGGFWKEGASALSMEHIYLALVVRQMP
jgi:hypothetical protein